MNHKLIQFIIIFFILLGCSNDDDSSSISSDVNSITLVTGINIRMSDVSESIKLGNPNVFIGSQFLAFPNPPSDNITIQSFNTISDIWMIAAHAEKKYQETDFDEFLDSDLYTEETVDSKAELKFNEINSSNLTINIEDLNPGYYRVFVKINGSLYWDNLYIPDDSFEIDDLIESWQE